MRKWHLWEPTPISDVLLKFFAPLLPPIIQQVKVVAQKKIAPSVFVSNEISIIVSKS